MLVIFAISSWEGETQQVLDGFKSLTKPIFVLVWQRLQYPICWAKTEAVSVQSIKVVNDRRVEDRPCFATVEGMWRPLVWAGKHAGSIGEMKVRDTRARYFNRDTGVFEEVEVLELICMEGPTTILCTQDYLSDTYVHIRRADGEELHAQASLVCKKGESGYAEPDYIF